jgi:hypothetical protein
MSVFKTIAFVLVFGFSTALPGLGEAEQQSGEVIVIKGCPGGKFSVEQSDGTKVCLCPGGETDVLGQCVSDSLIDFFDNPWGVVCSYWGCDSGGGGGGRPPSIDICVLDDGTTCADEFNFCRTEFASDQADCRAQARKTAEVACNRNLWPNNSPYQNWHRVGSYYCPSAYDDPNSILYWAMANHGYSCVLAADLHDDCIDAWLVDATTGGGGTFTILGTGGGGTSGGAESGPLAAARCNLKLVPELEACIDEVINEMGCPVGCDVSPTERIVFNPLRPDQTDLDLDGAERAVLVAVNRLQAERFINRLGYEYLARREPERAIEAFRVNVENFPNSANAHESLAEALEDSGRFRLAAASYRQALQFDPDMQSAQKGLERLQYPGTSTD